jgi:hypothetical protein
MGQDGTAARHVSRHAALVSELKALQAWACKLGHPVHQHLCENDHGLYVRNVCVTQQGMVYCFRFSFAFTHCFAGLLDQLHTRLATRMNANEPDIDTIVCQPY